MTMEARLSYFGNATAAKFAKYINSAGAVVTESALPASTQELVKIRASQINGCAGCLDMHTKDAELALINTYNRLNVITRQPAGDYKPGQWG
jgi:AhpD family alkylhydroperoxidase